MAKTPRVTTLDTKAALVQTTTAIKQADLNPIGMIISSMLTETQFQALNGTSWVLIDGRSVAGSTYATITGLTTLPDARGMVLRGKNSGGSSAGTRADGSQNPDGDLGLGTYQADQFASHNHFVDRSNNPGPANIAPGSNGYINNGSTGSAGGNETRMKNITVNHFIKINP